VSVTDEERIGKRLALLRETSGLLSKEVPGSEEDYRKADRKTKDATERRLQIISEVELDIVRTLYKDLGKRVVGDEESLIEAMEDLLGKKVTQQVKKRRWMRNKLVRAYLDIDAGEIFGQASELEDIKDFEKAVEKALAGTTSR
jgi:uncharacterized protein YutE (UPF0331/DUF86 family)